MKSFHEWVAARNENIMKHPDLGKLVQDLEKKFSGTKVTGDWSGDKMFGSFPVSHRTRSLMTLHAAKGLVDASRPGTPQGCLRGDSCIVNITMTDDEGLNSKRINKIAAWLDGRGAKLGPGQQFQLNYVEKS